MDDVSLAGWDECDEAIPGNRVDIRGEYVWIDGIRIVSSDCPECLKGEEGQCLGCSFFDAESCLLRHDPELRGDIKFILAEARQRAAAKQARQRRFVKALRAELRAHGRPLHYSVLVKMMADRHPGLRITEARVLGALGSAPEMFEKTYEGVYQLKAR